MSNPSTRTESAPGGGLGSHSRVRPRVLVVEDQFLLAQSVCAALTELGYEVIGPVASVEDAKRLVEAHDPHAAILNYRLDHTTTAELARELCGRGCPTVFLSALDKQAPKDLHQCPWLPKPFDRERFAATLRAILPR